MKNKKPSGIALITGCLLLAFTMALHPSGGNLAHLQKIALINAVAHSVGLTGVLVLCFGFITLKNNVEEYPSLSLAALIITIAGLSAGFLAAIVNGIALPIFINQFTDENSVSWSTAKVIIGYGTSLNHALDFVMIGAINIAVLFWSILLYKSKLISRYINYLGIFIVVLFVIFLFSGFLFVDLHGFRLFILGFILWLFVLGSSLLKTKSDSLNNLK